MTTTVTPGVASPFHLYTFEVWPDPMPAATWPLLQPGHLPVMATDAGQAQAFADQAIQPGQRAQLAGHVRSSCQPAHPGVPGTRQIDLRGGDLAGDVSTAAWAAHRQGTVAHLCDEHGPVAAIIPAGYRGLTLRQPVLIRGLAGPAGEPLAGTGFFLGVHDVSRPSEDPDVDVLIGGPAPAGDPDAARVYTVRRSQLTPLYEGGRS